MMMKFLLIAVVLGATVFQNTAEAQRRGYGPTRADRDRWEQRGRQPIVVIPGNRPISAPISLLQEAIRGRVIGCTVQVRADGYHHHLYVRGAFAGSFRAGAEDYLLSAAIDTQVRRGICRLDHYASTYEAIRLEMLRNPYLIEDFANHRSSNCHVRLGVSGWANQIYINGHFSGNYHMHGERERLRQDLATYVANGTCQFGY